MRHYRLVSDLGVCLFQKEAALEAAKLCEGHLSLCRVPIKWFRPCEPECADVSRENDIGGFYKSSEDAIYLRCLTDEDAIRRIVAHELRHAWQMRRYGRGSRLDLPLFEADADEYARAAMLKLKGYRGETWDALAAAPGVELPRDEEDATEPQRPWSAFWRRRKKRRGKRPCGPLGASWSRLRAPPHVLRSGKSRRSGHLPAGTMLEHITAKQCEAFFRRPDLSRTSRSMYARHLRAFFNWCAAANMLKHSPMKDVAILKAPGKVPAFLTREQYKHLIETIDAYATVMESDVELTEMLEEAVGLDLDRSKHATIQEGEVRWMVDIVTVACGTGMRSGEIRSMRWDWIDLSEGTITIQETEDFSPKNGDDRMIYVSGDALKVLRRRYEYAGEPMRSLVFGGLRAEKISKEYLGKRFRFFRDLAKLPRKLSFHSTRHTYASWLVQQGVDLYCVQKLCGHRSMQTTMRYAHLAPKNLKDAVQQTFGS